MSAPPVQVVVEVGDDPVAPPVAHPGGASAEAVTVTNALHPTVGAGRPMSTRGLRTNTIVPVARQFSNSTIMTRGLTETFYCQICMCRHPQSEAFILRACKHQFCRTCATAYIDGKVKESSVYLRCIYDKAADEDGTGLAPLAPSRRSLPAAIPPVTATSPLIAAAMPPGGTPTPTIGGASAGDVTITVTPAATDLNNNNNRAAGAAAAAGAASIGGVPIARNPSLPALADDGTCGRAIEEADILEALKDHPDAVARYHRFKATADDPNTRHCPYSPCTGSQPGKASEPRMVCVTCGKEYCFTHSNAHPGKSCEAYERETLQDTKLSEATINKDSKRCPNPTCGIPIQKSSGCNHMKCPKCKTNFCWLCGKQCDSSTLPVHYAWWNLRGCPGRQFSESSAPAGCCDTFCRVIAMIFTGIFLGIPALIATVVSFILCPCICIPCYYGMRENEETGEDRTCGQFFYMVTVIWMMIIGMVIMGLLSVPLSIIASAIGLVCCPCIVILRVCMGNRS